MFMELIKRIFKSAVRAVKKFLKIAIPKVLRKIFAELQEFAIEVIDNLQYSDLSNENKREEAVKRIKDRAEYMRIDISNSAINLLIELAVQYLKNK